MKIIDVYCIENFITNNNVKFDINCMYKIVIYPEFKNIFYVAKVPETPGLNSTIYAAYPLDKIYMNKFITIKQLRKRKLEKINENR